MQLIDRRRGQQRFDAGDECQAQGLREDVGIQEMGETLERGNVHDGKQIVLHFDALDLNLEKCGHGGRNRDAHQYRRHHMKPFREDQVPAHHRADGEHADPCGQMMIHRRAVVVDQTFPDGGWQGQNVLQA